MPSQPPPPPSQPPRARPPPPNLDSLPLDILHLHIAPLLPYPALLALSSVSRALHATINPSTLASQKTKSAFFLTAERFPQHRRKLACFRCCQILPEERFGEGQRRGRMGKYGSGDESRKAGRVCWDCGMQGRVYTHGRGVRWKGGRWYPCHGCGRAREGGRCPGGEDGVGCEGWVDGEEGEEKRGLEGLPGWVLERVLGMVGYRDLVMLRQVNRFLRGVVKPVEQCGDVYSMHEFVMGRLRARGRMFHEYACFGCFRVREAAKFSREQRYLSATADAGDYWRRRCWECLRRFYHPTSPDCEARDRFRNQVICNTCRCLWTLGTDCTGCVARADDIAEWARLKEEKRRALGEVHDLWGESEDRVQQDGEDEGTGLKGDGQEHSELLGESSEGIGLWDTWLDDDHLSSGDDNGTAATIVWF